MAEEFVRKDVYEADKGHTAQRFEAAEKLVNSAVERMEAMMDKNLAKHETIAVRLEGKIDTLTERMNTTIAQYNAFANSVEGDVKAINARFETLQSRFAWNLAWVGIIMGLVLSIVQRLWQ